MPPSPPPHQVQEKNSRKDFIKNLRTLLKQSLFQERKILIHVRWLYWAKCSLQVWYWSQVLQSISLSTNGANHSHVKMDFSTFFFKHCHSIKLSPFKCWYVNFRVSLSVTKIEGNHLWVQLLVGQSSGAVRSCGRMEAKYSYVHKSATFLMQKNRRRVSASPSSTHCILIKLSPFDQLPIPSCRIRLTIVTTK